jgi:hypothetical protein
MSKQHQPPPPRGHGPDPKNQGEGDRESARRFNQAQQSFAESPRGRSAIEHAGDVDPNEREALEEAEKVGLSHVKEEDPEVLRRPPAMSSKSQTKTGKKVRKTSVRAPQLKDAEERKW